MHLYRLNAFAHHKVVCQRDSGHVRRLCFQMFFCFVFGLTHLKSGRVNSLNRCTVFNRNLSNLLLVFVLCNEIFVVVVVVGGCVCGYY